MHSESGKGKDNNGWACGVQNNTSRYKQQTNKAFRLKTVVPTPKPPPMSVTATASTPKPRPATTPKAARPPQQQSQRRINGRSFHNVSAPSSSMSTDPTVPAVPDNNNYDVRLFSKENIASKMVVLKRKLLPREDRVEIGAYLSLSPLSCMINKLPSI